MSALCNGIKSVRRIRWRCPHWECRRVRATLEMLRYDSSILRCSVGHTWITGDPDGLHYAGKHRTPFRRKRT